MNAYETSLAAVALYIVIVVGCVIGFLVNSTVRQHRQRVALQQQYLFEQACLLEEERSRIAQDLHDGVGALLWFALMLLEVYSHWDVHCVQCVGLKVPGTEPETKRPISFRNSRQRKAELFNTLLDKLVNKLLPNCRHILAVVPRPALPRDAGPLSLLLAV